MSYTHRVHTGNPAEVAPAHDHLFVDWDQAAQALALLREL
jgi:hypothetical protein